MKRKYIHVAAALLCASSLMFSSCIGSFSLTNKLLSWNRQVGDKVVNELVFFAFWVLPVYEVSAFVDLVVLNSIEFWSGSNPMAQGRSVIEGEDGRYLVDCDGKGYTITSVNDGSQVRLDFDVEEQTWSIDVEGTSYPLITFVDDTHVKLPAPGNKTVTVALDNEGLWAYQQVASSAFTASR